MGKNQPKEVNLLNIYEYVIYFHILFCLMEAIIDQHGKHGLVTCFAIFPRNFSKISLLYCPTKWRLPVAHMGKTKPFKCLRLTTPQLANRLYTHCILLTYLNCFIHLTYSQLCINCMLSFLLQKNWTCWSMHTYIISHALSTPKQLLINARMN